MHERGAAKAVEACDAPGMYAVAGMRERVWSTCAPMTSAVVGMQEIWSHRGSAPLPIPAALVSPSRWRKSEGGGGTGAGGLMEKIRDED
jgi:hypothetical protein